MDTKNEDQTGLGWRLTIPQAASAILAGTYLAGFLVLNSHLGKRGIFDFSLANSRYLIAGVLFIVFLVIWYLFAGRSIIFAKKWIDEDIESAIELGLGRSWHIIIQLSAILRVVFFTCISSAAFSVTISGSAKPREFLIYLLALFLIAYLSDFLNFDRRFPRAYLIFEPASRAVGILVFFTTVASDSPTMSVIVHFAIMSVYVNLVLESFDRFKITIDRLTFHIIYSAVFVLLSSSIFGLWHYEHIKPAFGGGQLQVVEIMIGDQTVRNGLMNMGFEVTPSLKANLVHENQQEFIVEIEGQTIRLSRKTVAGFKVLPVEDSH